MKRVMSVDWYLTVLFFFGIASTPVFSIDARQPLTFRNTGVYGGFAGGIAKESPFDFLIVQASVLDEGLPAEMGQAWSEQGPQWNSMLHQARGNGKRVIADIGVHLRTEDGGSVSFQQGGPEASKIPPEKFMRLFDAFFAAVDEHELYAVTLAEENIFWDGQQEKLEHAYAYLKARYDVPLFQWWSPSSSDDTTPGMSWPNLPADGWGVDEYFHAQPLFERAIRGYVVQHKPLFQIIWAAPDHPSVPWLPQTFWDQAYVCRKYNIPMAFFTWVGRNDTSYSNTWGWDTATSPTNRHVFEQYCLHLTEQVKRLPAMPYEEWDFVPWAPKVIALTPDGEQPNQVRYHESFAKQRYVRAWEDADIQGFAHLHWDSSPIQLRPRQAGPAEASLRYLFTSPGPPARITAMITGTNFVSGVSLHLEDAAGRRLAEAALVDGRASVNWESGDNDTTAERFAVVCRLQGQADRPGEVLAELAGIDIRVDLREKTVLPALGLSEKPNPNQRPPDLAKQWLRNHPFMINCWAATAGGVTMHLFTQANFNSVLTNPSGYQFTADAGLDAHELGSFTQLDAEAKNKVDSALKLAHLEGWLIGDEIAPEHIDGVAHVADYIRSLDTSRIIYAGLGSSGEAYIDNVLSTIKPDAAIHGWYWVINPDILPGIDFYSAHFYELDMCRRKAQEYGLPLFWYIQSFSDINSTEDTRDYRYLPSESQLRMDIFSGLAFGVKGIIYFLFDARLGGPTVLNAVLDKNGSPSPLYEPAKQANKEVLNVGKALRFLESTDVRFIPGQPANPIPPSMTAWSSGAGGDTHIQNIQIVQQGTYKDGLIGFFTDDLGQKYFMLVNLYQGSGLDAAAATLNFNVTFDASVTTVWRLRRSDGVAESVAVPSNTLSLTLPGGTGDLFKYDNGNFQTSGLSDAEQP